MTEDVAGIDTAEESPVPEGHYYAELLGRKILVKEINSAQAMMLGTIYRSLDRDSIEDGLAALGRLGTLFEALIVTAKDRDFLEEAILRGQAELSDFAGIFRASKKDMTPTTGPKKPRRGRQ